MVLAVYATLECSCNRSLACLAFLCSAIYCTVGGKKWSQKDSIFYYRIVHINFSSTALAFFGEINKKIPGCFLDIF